MINRDNMSKFNYEILKQTDKAVYAKIPYWSSTGKYTKKHKQLWYESWIPKSVLASGDDTAKDFVLSQRKEKYAKSGFGKFTKYNKDWDTLGEYAPVKTERKVQVVDENKRKEIISAAEKKYGTSYRNIIHNGDVDGVITDKEYKILVALEYPKVSNPLVPTKTETLWE